MDVYFKNLFDNHTKRTDNNGPSTTNNNKTTDTTMVEIVIFDDNIISSQPQQQPQYNSNSNHGNKQMVLNIRQHRSIPKDDVHDVYDCDNSDKNSINHDQNKNKNHNAHLCHRHILVHENRNQRFFLLRPCVLSDKNHSNSSISMRLSDTHCSYNNNYYKINRNTNTMKSKRKLTARMEKHRLSRWGSSSPSRWDSSSSSSSSSSVSTITETLRLHEIHDISPKKYSRRLSPARSKATATTDKLDFMNQPISRFLFKLLEPPQRQSSDLDSFPLPGASTIKYVYYSPISKAA